MHNAALAYPFSAIIYSKPAELISVSDSVEDPLFCQTYVIVILKFRNFTLVCPLDEGAGNHCPSSSWTLARAWAGPRTRS